MYHRLWLLAFHIHSGNCTVTATLSSLHAMIATPTQVAEQLKSHRVVLRRQHLYIIPTLLLSCEELGSA